MKLRLQNILEYHVYEESQYLDDAERDSVLEVWEYMKDTLNNSRIYPCDDESLENSDTTSTSDTQQLNTPVLTLVEGQVYETLEDDVEHLVTEEEMDVVWKAYNRFVEALRSKSDATSQYKSSVDYGDKGDSHKDGEMKLSKLKQIVDLAINDAGDTDPSVEFYLNGDKLEVDRVGQFSIVPDLCFYLNTPGANHLTAREQQAEEGSTSESGIVSDSGNSDSPNFILIPLSVYEPSDTTSNFDPKQAEKDGYVRRVDSNGAFLEPVRYERPLTTEEAKQRRVRQRCHWVRFINNGTRGLFPESNLRNVRDVDTTSNNEESSSRELADVDERVLSYLDEADRSDHGESYFDRCGVDSEDLAWEVHKSVDELIQKFSPQNLRDSSFEDIRIANDLLLGAISLYFESWGVKPKAPEQESDGECCEYNCEWDGDWCQSDEFRDEYEWDGDGTDEMGIGESMETGEVGGTVAQDETEEDEFHQGIGLNVVYSGGSTESSELNAMVSGGASESGDVSREETDEAQHASLPPRKHGQSEDWVKWLQKLAAQNRQAVEDNKDNVFYTREYENANLTVANQQEALATFIESLRQQLFHTREENESLAQALDAVNHQATEYREQIVWGHFEQPRPRFIQGSNGEHEINEVVTAEDVQRWMDRLMALEKENADLMKKLGQPEGDPNAHYETQRRYNGRSVRVGSSDVGIVVATFSSRDGLIHIVTEDGNRGKRVFKPCHVEFLD